MRLRARWTLFFGLLAAAAAALLIGVFDRSLRRVVDERAAERLSLELNHLAGDVGRLRDEAEREVFLRRAAADLACRITHVAPDGRVLHETGLPTAEVARMENHASREEIREALAGDSGGSRRYSATNRTEMLYRARRLADGSVLRMAVSAEHLKESEAVYLWEGRVAILAASALLFLIGAVAAARLSRPVDELTGAAAAIAAGDYERPLPAIDSEPLRRLGRALQRMKDSLVAALARAESERRLSAMVFERLPDGLVIVDDRLHVLESNERFRADDRRPLPGGKSALRPPAASVSLRALREDLAHRRNVAPDGAPPDDVVWEVLVFPLPAGSRAAAVGVLRDITRLERTETMRRTFVADVSHELRTPISSIAAAAETLGDGGADGAETQELVGVIRRQSERMRELIDDLTDLAQIESGAITLGKENVVLSSLLREVAQDLAAGAREKQVEIVVSGDEAAAVPGDRRRLAQVARNLLDNAVKFSPEGGRVELRAFAEPGRAGFSVADDGPGIPKAERDRIFQRFYQIDRSRSKTRPGSGLGLSIVKHLVHLHGGSIEVEGNVGAGSLFVVRLPT